MYIHVHPYMKNNMEARGKEKGTKGKGGKDRAGQCVVERSKTKQKTLTDKALGTVTRPYFLDALSSCFLISPIFIIKNPKI